MQLFGLHHCKDIHVHRSLTTSKSAIKIMNCDILKKFEKLFNQIGACLF